MKKYKLHFLNPIKSTKPKSQKTDAFWVRAIGSGILDVLKGLNLVHKKFIQMTKQRRCFIIKQIKRGDGF